MPLEIGHNLDPEQIKRTISNIENSSNELVKKVLAEETTYKREHEKLKTYGEKEFYQRRNELIDALNHYTFNETISEKKKNILNYKLFHRELEDLKKEKRGLKAMAWGGVPSATGLTYLLFTIDPILAGVLGVFIGIAGIGASIAGAVDTNDLNKKAPEGFVVLRMYYDLRSKSKNADKFMKDFEILKDYPGLYEDLNENDDSIHKVSNKDSDL